MVEITEKTMDGDKSKCTVMIDVPGMKPCEMPLEIYPGIPHQFHFNEETAKMIESDTLRFRNDSASPGCVFILRMVIYSIKFYLNFLIENRDAK